MQKWILLDVSVSDLRLINVCNNQPRGPESAMPVRQSRGFRPGLCLCASVVVWRVCERRSRERRGLNSLLVSPSVLIRVGWLEASALASTAEAAVGDEEASGSHEKCNESTT